MEQQSKYYTPDISELHVGYEYELRDVIMGDEVWYKWVMTSRMLYAIEDNHHRFRTKYLDQSDIESCGWIKDWDENSNYSDCYKLLTKSDINGQSDDEWVLWQYDKIVSISNELSNRCFDGECKSINELRKIMEWLNIK